MKLEDNIIDNKKKMKFLRMMKKRALYIFIIIKMNLLRRVKI